MLKNSSVFKAAINVCIAALAVATLFRHQEAIAQAWRTIRGEAVPALVAPNMRLSVRGITWSDSDRSVVLLASKGCRPCEQSRAFYAELAGQVRRLSGVRLIVLTPQSREEMVQWLGDAGIASALVVHVDDPSNMGFLVFPTLMFVDSRGFVTDVVLGKLDDQWQAAVTRRLDSGTLTTPLDNTAYVSEVATFEELPTENGRRVAQVVDIRTREEFSGSGGAGAKNIPADDADGDGHDDGAELL